MRLKFSRSQIRILYVADFLQIRGLILIFLFSLDRAALWSCSRKFLRSAASPLCKKLFLKTTLNKQLTVLAINTFCGTCAATS